MTQPISPASQASEVVQPTGKRNIIGIIALVVAILGIIFSCVKGALIIGWVLLPIAFILGLVGLFGRDKKKGTAIAAVILSIVGTIIAVIVFVAVIGESFSEATGGDTSVSNDAPSADSASSEPDASDPGSSAAGETRDTPLPLGTTIENDDWAVTVNSVNLDGTEQVAAGNPFNEAAPEGQQYIIVNITATLKKDVPEGTIPETTVEYVSPDGVTYNSYDHVVTMDSNFDNLGTLYQGASTTGDIAIAVPSSTVDQGVLAVRPAMFADKKFVAVQ